MANPASRFEFLLGAIKMQSASGSDVLLEMNDIAVLLDGVERLKSELELAQGKVGRGDDWKKARHIMAMLCHRHGVTMDEILSKRRYREISRARHDMMVHVYEACKGLSLPDIGSLFNVDHTSVLYAIRKARVPRREAPQALTFRRAA